MSLHTLNHYARRIQSVKRSNGKAPHKPVFLLSILDLMEGSYLTENRVAIDKNLNQLFKNNWQKFGIDDYSPTLENPVFYLQSDGFWTAYDNHGQQLTDRTAISKTSAGKLEEELFNLLQSNTYRPLLRMVLLDM